MSPNSRDKLMDAARTLFFRRGVAGVSVDDICKAAGLQKGSFYHFFETKEALLLAVMEKDHAEWERVLQNIFSPEIQPLERMARFAAEIETSQKTYETEHGIVIGIPYMTLGCETAPEAGRICSQSDKMGCRIESYFAQTLKDAHKEGLVEKTNFEAAGRQLAACTAGLLTHARIQNSLTHLRKDVETLFSLYMGGHPLPKVKGSK